MMNDKCPVCPLDLVDGKCPVDVREALSDYAHVAWSDCLQYLLDQGIGHSDGTVTILAPSVEWWKRQIATSYRELSESEQDSDRKEADRMLAIVEPLIAHVRYDALEEAAKVCEGGRFLHDDAPDTRFGKACANAIRKLQGGST